MIGIILEGGLVQKVIDDSNTIKEAVIIDYDIEGMDESKLNGVKQDDGALRPACIHVEPVTRMKIKIE